LLFFGRDIDFLGAEGKTGACLELSANHWAVGRRCAQRGLGREWRRGAEPRETAAPCLLRRGQRNA
jgi:hypothetical protein